MKLFEFKPKLVSCLKNYSKETFMADLMAGIIVGIVALPLAIAFGIASGVSPEKGIITAIIAGFIISLLGGSKVQIGGPTGAFIVIIYGIIQQYGEAGLIVATLMAGVLLILLGVFKLGAVIKFIPYPIIVGFTSGIAVTIFTTQIADIFGLSFGDEKVPGDFVGKWLIYFRHFDTINWWNTIVSIVSIIIIAITPKFSKKIPGSLIAIIVVTVAVYLMKTFGGIDCIQTIGDRFTIKSELPDAVVPALDWEAIRELFPVAITIAVLGAIESLLSATVADGVIGDRHDSNTELIARMKKEVPIWNINSFAEFYLQIFGKYEKDYIKACRNFVVERESFYYELCKIPYLYVVPSQANYFLCEVIDKYTSTELVQKLIEHDVIVSDCGRKNNMNGRNLVRLAIRGREDNLKLISILKTL